MERAAPQPPHWPAPWTGRPGPTGTEFGGPTTTLTADPSAPVDELSLPAAAGPPGTGAPVSRRRGGRLAALLSVGALVGGAGGVGVGATLVDGRGTVVTTSAAAAPVSAT